MELRFYHDAQTGLPHLFQHGVSMDEVEDVLARPVENLPGRQDSRVAIGRTRAGRTLKVIYVPDADGESMFVVTAFDLRGKPLRAFNRRQRRRGVR